MKTFKTLIGIAALGLAMITLTARADGPITPPTEIELVPTNTLSVASNGTFTATVTAGPNESPTIKLSQNADLRLLLLSYAENTGTSNTTYYFNLGQGTNWTTMYPLSATVAQLGANSNASQTFGTNFYWNLTNFAGFDSLRCDKVVTAQTNAVHSRLLFGQPQRVQ